MIGLTELPLPVPDAAVGVVGAAAEVVFEGDEPNVPERFIAAVGVVAEVEAEAAARGDALRAVACSESWRDRASNSAVAAIAVGGLMAGAGVGSGTVTDK